MISLEDALNAVADRKIAAFGEGRVQQVESPAGLALLLVGWELDAEEVLNAATEVAAMTVFTARLSGATPYQAVGSAWVEGLMTGMMLANLRARE